MDRQCRITKEGKRLYKIIRLMVNIYRKKRIFAEFAWLKYVKVERPSNCNAIAKIETTDMKMGSVALSIPFSCILGFLAWFPCCHDLFNHGFGAVIWSYMLNFLERFKGHVHY
ncbi:hypothetical protein AgCh_009661 [Apium graveolens]